MQHTSFAPLKLSAAVMLACLSFAAQAQTANKVEKTDKEVPVSPFAFLNLNLQASESSSGNFNIPPRLMILFDDSGSMGHGVQGLPNSSPWVNYTRQGGVHQRVLHVSPRGAQTLKANRSCVTNKDYPHVRADAYDFGGKYGVKLDVPRHHREYGNVLFPSFCFACKDGSKPNIKFSTWLEYELVDSSGRIKRGNSISCGRNTYRQYTQLFDPNSKAIPAPMLTDVIVSTYSQGVSPEENTRMGVARKALTNIVDRYKDEFSWSLMSLWGTEKRLTQFLPVNAVPYFAEHYGDTRVHEFTKAGTANDYAAFKDSIKRLRPGGYTPTTTRYLQAVDYLISTKEYICQNDYVIIFSDGDANVENIRDHQFRAYQHSDFYGNLPYNYQISGPGPQNGIAFFSRILDGRSSGRHGQSGDTKSSRFSYYSSSSSYMNRLFAGNDKDNTQWDGFEHGGEMYFDKQPIKTFSIAFGGDTSAQGNAYLRDASSNNKVYNAVNEQELNRAFEDILGEINKDNEEHKPNFETGFSASSAAFAGAGDQKLDRLAAQLTLNPQTWSSEFKFLKLDKQGKQTTESVPADYSNRKVIISYVDGNGRQLTEDMTTNSRHLSYLFGFDASQRDEFQYAFLPWYLRSGSTDADIERNAKYYRDRGMRTKVKQYRQRTANAYDPARMMADVMGAPVVALDYSKGRPRYMLTAANDGMMYLFEKTDNNNRPYTLRLNYLPASMQRESTDFSDTVAKAAVALAETDYGSTLTSENVTQDSKPHLFLNSGGIQWRQTSADKNGNSATYIAGAMGQGGRGAYVLAISGKDRAAATPVGLDNHESSWVDKVPMWETPKGQNNQLGYTVSTPQFAQVATKLTEGVKDKTQGVRQLLFLANGYDAPAKVLTAPTLYIYDALGQDMGKQAPVVKTGNAAGSLVKAIPVKDGWKGLSTPTLVDIDADNLADVAYAGDQGGNLYRFDLRGEVDTWTAHKIYNGKESQPITAAPAVYKESSDSYMVIVGTGSDIYQKDLEDKSQQVVLGIRDNLTEKTPTPIEQSQLVEQKILGTTGTSGTGGDKKTLRYLTRKTVADGSPGWMLTLGSDGERVVTQASVINRTAVFTSRVYTTKKSSSAPNTSSQSNNAYSCKINKTSTKSESTGWLFAVDVKTGSNPLEGSAYFKDLGEQSKTSFNAGEKEAIEGDEALKVAALQIDGLSSGATLNSFEALARTVKAVNANGAFGSGQDLAIDAAQGRNDCVEHGDYTVGVVSSTTGYESTGLEAFKCPTEGGRLIRINSRPIIE